LRSWFRCHGVEWVSIHPVGDEWVRGDSELRCAWQVLDISRTILGCKSDSLVAIAAEACISDERNHIRHKVQASVSEHSRRGHPAQQCNRRSRDRKIPPRPYIA